MNVETYRLTKKKKEIHSQTQCTFFISDYDRRREKKSLKLQK